MRTLLACVCAVLSAQQQRIVIPSPGAERDILGFPSPVSVMTNANGPFSLVAPRIFGVDAWRFHAPDWLKDVRVNLKAATPDELREKLIEQLSLIWHTEQGIMEVWVVRRRRAEPPASDRRRMPFPAGARGGVGGTTSQVRCDGCELSWILSVLQWSARMPVIDETGLKGWYRFDLQWKTNDDEDAIRVWRENANLDLVKEMRTLPIVVVDDAARPKEPDPPRFACEAASGVQAEIDALPAVDDLSHSYEERMAPRRALAKKYPYDVFVQMAVQDDASGSPHLWREWDEALAAYPKLDHPFLGDFFEARLRLALQKRRSAELLAGVLRQAPDFPWAHLQMLRWIELHSPSDTATAEYHLREFRKLCPGSPAVLEHLAPVTDMALLREIEGKLNTFNTPSRLKPSAWRLMLRTHGAETPATRAVIGRDIALARFRPHTLEWARAMRDGYKLVRDEAGSKWIGDIIVNEFPASTLAYEFARERGGAAWREQFPELPQSVLERWRAVTASPKPDAGALAAAANAFLDAAARYPDVTFSVPPAPVQVAEVYARQRVRLEDLKRLVQQGIEQIELQEKHRRESDVAAQRDAAEKNVAETYRRAGALLKVLQNLSDRASHQKNLSGRSAPPRWKVLGGTGMLYPWCVLKDALI